MKMHDSTALTIFVYVVKGMLSLIFGGIPYYLNMLDRDLPLSINIDRLMFADNAPLKTEYEFLFRSLFNDSNNYRKVVEALSTKLKGLLREEISQISGVNGGELTNILKNLSACDFRGCRGRH